MVCLGNICRSPLAHGILQHKIDTLALNWLVDSAGTATYHIGNLPDKRSVNIAEKHGIDITKQRARQFRKEDFDAFDLIYVMDSFNYQNVCNLAQNPQHKNKVHLLLNESYPKENRAVPDPYYGGDEGFTTVYNLLDAATDSLLERLI